MTMSACSSFTGLNPVVLDVDAFALQNAFEASTVRMRQKAALLS